MRRTIVSAFTAVLAGPAMAADIGVATPSYKIPPYLTAEQTAFNWTGNYVGVHIGGAKGDFSFSPIASPALGGAGTSFGDTSSNGNDAFIGGFQVGRNWQFGRWVLGFEHDAQFTKLNGSITTGSGVAAPFAEGDSFNAKVSYLSATRVKVGYAWDRVVAYVAGGLEMGRVDVTANYAPRTGIGAGAPLSFEDTRKLQFGYTVGAGAEYAFTNNVSFGVEYRYLTLNKATYNLGTVTSAAGDVSNVTADVGLKSSQVLVRMNVKFDGLALSGF
ncbi:outer membrane immunogenic protein [Bradyrhizobium sp. R2.2-H]|uniref:outer membrane protein n=1 Tax=unclassified Bradyrhizobium TaxID=2631580 RepID=UPI00104C46E2|nr:MULTISPECIES: outer membrane beta-barrel protein [unclassified Bradyrhizobium]TCU79004.1 outer membrane immunogenic protein [Bradyrhizobium sp. Y-H1]TCU81087.1 outer membrane immunogenic protein [Bradyrhizobium sp. R2.2-H]